MFTVYNKAETDSTVVSNLFIDQYMCDANDAQIKIYLYLIRMMSAQEVTSISDMADKFNHTEKEVLRSLKYWERKDCCPWTMIQAERSRGFTCVSREKERRFPEIASFPLHRCCRHGRNK